MSIKKSSYFEKLEKTYGHLSFGSLLKAWREAEGLSQTEFAEMLDLSRQNASDLEHGRRIPSPSRAAKIAKKLGLPQAPLIALALRDALEKEGFKYEVKLETA